MTHRINQAQRVAVATDYYWQPMETCPKGVKVQLLNPGGVATYSSYSGPDKNGKEIWEGWAPLPKRAPKEMPKEARNSEVHYMLDVDIPFYLIVGMVIVCAMCIGYLYAKTWW